MEKGIGFAVMELRDVPTLTAVNDAWPLLLELIDQSPVSARALPRETSRASEALHRLQVSTRSALGALAYNCGGIVIESGWLRLLGGGHDELHSLAQANDLGEPPPDTVSPGFLVVAEDVLGGRFAIDGGALGAEHGTVCYYGPDTLAWSSLGHGHGDFVRQMLAGAGPEFYADLRWPGWLEEVEALALDQGISLWPPPCTVEGQDLAAASRNAVPHAELVAFYDDFARQLG